MNGVETGDSISTLLSWLTDPARLGALFRAVLLLTVGVVLARGARYAIKRGLGGFPVQQQQLFARFAYYGVLGLFGVSAMRQLGFDFAVVLGAAGIVTVAIGFASQTSASNLISGLFLVMEKAVQAGDIVTVDGVTGEVLTVDLLSTKLRTFDNLQVRIPNETMVKARITTLNRFPLRRIDLTVGVAYESDLGLVQKTLFEVAQRNPLVLDEPAPLLISQGFGDSSIDYLLAVWGKSENFLTVRNTVTREIKEAFDAAGIEIPFPQRTLQPGTTPLEIRLLRAPAGGSAGATGTSPEAAPDGPPSAGGTISERQADAAAPRSTGGAGPSGA
ncbi:MAG: mechanosensitive ion channel family protein [Trueperaceae bacterium]|nr:MAG: mechanosensitive ion channel family protein [Trueperaceae bacterium]